VEDEPLERVGRREGWAAEKDEAERDEAPQLLIPDS